MSPAKDVTFPRLLFLFSGFIGMLLTVTAVTIWPRFLETKFEAYLRAKAKASQGPTTPRLYLFPVPYIHQKHIISPFTVTDPQACIGFSSFGHD
jgi:hypothetical protein